MTLRSNTRGRWLAHALCALLVHGATQARADEGDAPNHEEHYVEEDTKAPEVAEAERYAAEAFEAYTRRDYVGAVSLYLQALTASPSAGVLYNLARIYDTRLRDRELASKFYRRYIVDPGADAEHVRIANERLNALRELERSARAAERAPPPFTQAPAAEPAREARLSAVQIAGLASGALGLAGVGAGIAFAVGAKSDADAAKQWCDGDACRTQRGVDAARDGTRAANIATSCFAAGGALALAAAALLVLGRREVTRSERADLRLSLFASWHGAGLAGHW